MTVWKHHISSDFKDGISRNNGAGNGATVFLDYQKMIEVLKKDGRKWSVAELKVKKSELLFDRQEKYMATILVDRASKEGFKPIELCDQ